MKYNIGDKVRVKSLEWYNNNTSNGEEFIYCANFIPFTKSMSMFCGRVMTIKSIDCNNIIHLIEDNFYNWTEDMFEEFENIEITLNDKKYIINVEKAKELGVLEEKNTRCKSWEEFRKKYLCQGIGYSYDCCTKSLVPPLTPTHISDQLTKEEAIAIDSFSKLLKLRRDWIGDWNPDWSNIYELKHCIEVYRNEINVNSFSKYSKTFSFPTKEMAKEFLEYFKDLFEKCKYLI